MTMKNWKTNLGGAVSVTGTSLIAVGVLPQLGGLHSNILWWLALIGFILSCLGKGRTALFAADAATVKDLSQRVETVEGNSSPQAFIKPPDNPAQSNKL